MDESRALSERLQRELAKVSFSPDRRRHLVRALQAEQHQPRCALPWLPRLTRRLGQLWNTQWEIPLAPLVAATAVTIFLLLNSLLLLLQPGPAYHQLALHPAASLFQAMTEGVSLL